MSASSLVDAFGSISARCPGQMVAYGTTTLVAGASPQIVPGAGQTSWSASSPLVIVPLSPLLGTLSITKVIQSSGSYFTINSTDPLDVPVVSWWLYSTIPVGFI